MALADFVAPRRAASPTMPVRSWSPPASAKTRSRKRFKADKDDYNAILLSALADRLAEAFAERLHQRVRKEFWGYAPDESLGNDELIAETYRGIRPAPGYPAQPDHTEKGTLFRVLDAEAPAGVKLTENFAMWPGSSVSGLYLGHPDARYFGVGKIERDQVEDYARRKGWSSPKPNAGLVRCLTQPAQDRRGGVGGLPPPHHPAERAAHYGAADRAAGLAADGAAEIGGDLARNPVDDRARHFAGDVLSCRERLAV